jgi:predicted helicase
MPNIEQLQAVMTGTESNRIEALRRMLAYPVKQQRDPQGSRFWYLRPGTDELEVADTLPIAVGFYPELNEATQQEIVTFLTSKEQPPGIYEHYISRVNPDKPVMYILLPQQEHTGRVALILPTEGGLRQRQIQTFAWNDQQLLGRLSRLEQGRLPIAIKALNLIPLVEWVFYEAAKTAQELARELAKVTRRMEQAIPQVYNAEDGDGYLRKLFVSFQRELLPTLQLTSTNEKDYSFADIYAQTIAYGLFTARVFSYVKDERRGQDKETYFNREDAWQYLPETNPFLRRLFEDVSQHKAEELGEELIDAISEVFSILRAAKMDAILSDFRQKMNREDIVIRFYEDFLAAYKPQMRERRGVYYTPEPVVSYMVRSVDELLKDKFNKPLGLADPEVMILDPACGTGTFLLWICQLIYQRFQESPDALTEGIADKSWSGYVKERLLPRIFGFELLMAPYAIAHLKLGLFLEETGYEFDRGKRLGVYLTNTLDNAIRKTETLFEEFIAQEADQAAEIKRDKPIMVVVGNPPYSANSANTGEWATNLVRDSYYPRDEIKEQNPKLLLDDYVKFIRFAQWRIQQTGYGILSFITNHGYIDNPTFRGMRQSLMQTFNNIYILDTHGNSKKKEKALDGSKDENVFDIQQGVAIGILAQIPSNNKSSNIFHANTWGIRESKYEWLNKNNITTTKWIALQPQLPFSLFSPQDTALLPEYEQGLKIVDIMPLNSTGVKSHRDHFVFDFELASLQKNIEDFINLDISDIEISNAYDLLDTRDWKLNQKRKSLAINLNWRQYFTKGLYRPFDLRHYYHHQDVVELPKNEVMQNLLVGDNLGLMFMRQVAIQGNYNHFLATSHIADNRAFYSNKGAMQLAPLYIYPDSNSPKELQQPVHPNLSPEFLKAITSKLGYTPTPESIFYYIYAIFHSPTYRTRYAEFLKIDFPRVPLTSDDKLFRQLATYGEELVALHLMKSPKLDNLITEFIETTGNRLVDAGHPKFINENEVVINKKGDKFTGIPENIWNFYVGGYQVCQKWLKDRKGRQLNDEDIQHYQRIVVALQETIKLMDEIDQAIPEFPIQ